MHRLVANKSHFQDTEINMNPICEIHRNPIGEVLQFVFHSETTQSHL